jgi:hypothetical protein
MMVNQKCRIKKGRELSFLKRKAETSISSVGQ